MIWVLLGVLVAALFLPTLLSSTKGSEIGYGEFVTQLRDDQVQSAEFDNTNGQITGEFTNGEQFSTTGPVQLSDEDIALFTEKGVEFTTPTSSIWETLLPLLLPVGLIVLFLVWMQRRASSQMGGIMSIGRSKAKMYTTERPGTTFADVAGYEGVKQEINEVVDFLKYPERVQRDRRAASRRASCSSVPRAPARRSSPGPSPVRPACRSCRSPARTSWRCSSASAPAGSATCSSPPARWVGPSSSSTRSTPSAASAAPASAAGTTSVSRRSTRCWPRWTASR